MTLGLAMCNAGGVGGGTILTPLLIMFGKFKQTEAVALANLAILIAAGIRFFRNTNERHPRISHKLSIDYNLVLILMPMTLLGTSAGILINISFPDAVILILMTVVFLTAAFITLCKGIQKCKNERKQRKLPSKIGGPNNKSSLNSLSKIETNVGQKSSMFPEREAPPCKSLIM